MTATRKPVNYISNNVEMKRSRLDCHTATVSICSMTAAKNSDEKSKAEAAAVRLQSILINAADGQRNVADDRQYPQFRRQLMKVSVSHPRLWRRTRPWIPSQLRSKAFQDRQERIQLIRTQFDPVFRDIESLGSTTDAAIWTGNETRPARLKVIRGLLPLARSAVDSLIAELSAPNPNGAPILEERQEAIEQLRQLHTKLGELLQAVDLGHFDDDLGEGLAAEAARYAKRAARALGNDPMPYATSSLLLGMLWACGFPGIGEYLGTVALTVTKQKRKQR